MHNGSWVSFCVGQWAMPVIHCLLCYPTDLCQIFGIDRTMAVDDQPGSSLSVPERTSPGNQFLLVLCTEVTELIFVTLVARGAGAAGCANVLQTLVLL